MNFLKNVYLAFMLLEVKSNLIREIKVVNELEIEGAARREQTHTQTKYDAEADQKGVECVICMCEIRNTLILPCRHLCLCRICAVNLRIQSNNCPICRIPFVALLQLKLLRKKEAEKSPIQTGVKNRDPKHSIMVQN